MNLTELEKAYLAGLFDGEGHIGYYSYQFSAKITNTSPRIMMWLQERVKLGRIFDKFCGKTPPKNVQPTWEWRITTKADTVMFLATIRPYSIIKVDQIDLMLALAAYEGDTSAYKTYRKGGRNVRLPLPENIINMRNETEIKLKALKRSSSQIIM